MRRVGDRRAGLLDLRHHRIHFGFTPNIVAKRELRGTSRPKWNFGFMGEGCAGLNGELQPMLKIKEGDCTILEFRANDSLSRQAESIAIKPQRPFQIVNTESNDRDPWLHILTMAPAWRTKDKKL